MNMPHKHYQFFILFFSILLFAHLNAEHAEIYVSLTSHQTDNREFTNNKSHFSHDDTWNNSRIGSSYNHKHQFKQYNAHDFKQYFTNHEYTENQILNERCLYMFDEFVKFAQTYSGYKCTIQQLHVELQKLNFIQKAWYIRSGTYCRGLQKRIHYLYTQLDTIKTSQQNINNNNSPTLLDGSLTYTPIKWPDPSLETFPTQLPEYNALKDVYRAHSPSLGDAIDKRIDAYNSMFGTDYALHYASKSYNLNNNVKQLLHKYGHDTTRFTQCYGNQLEHVIHQESLDLLDHIDHLSYNSILYDHQEALVDFTVAMVDYNHEGCTDKATAIADFCWTLLDYGQAVGEGAALGIYSAATDILNNPIEATICLAAGKQVFTYQICKVLYNVADIGVTALSNIDHAKDKWNHYAEPLNNIIDKIYNKEVSVRDVIKSGTAFIVGYKAQVKLLGGLGKFCNTIKQKSINFVKNSPLLNPQEYLTTPEGLLFKATANVNKLKQSGQATASSLKNSIDTLKKLTTKETIDIAHKLKFKKTNYYSHGQPVFKKGNLYITPDMDGHNGGIWKMATSLENLRSKKTRLGTYDINLNRIGD